MARIENHKSVYVGDLVAPANDRFDQELLRELFGKHGLMTKLIDCVIGDDAKGHPYLIFNFNCEDGARDAKKLLGGSEFRRCFNYNRHVIVRYATSRNGRRDRAPPASERWLATLAISPSSETNPPVTSSAIVPVRNRRWETSAKEESEAAKKIAAAPVVPRARPVGRVHVFDTPPPPPSDSPLGKPQSVISAGVTPTGISWSDDPWGDNMLVTDDIPTFSPQSATDYSQVPVFAPGQLPTMRIVMYDGTFGTCIRVFDIPTVHFPGIDAYLTSLCRPFPFNVV